MLMEMVRAIFVPS